ncbi:MAG: DUF3806 domain-containing protein [Planctomycetes bacterium]|nr:DUF3806 domain-containing protein [Planctomycetota bacterium]
MTAPTFSDLSEAERQWIAAQLEGARQFVAAVSPSDASGPMTLEVLDRAWAAWLGREAGDQAEVNAIINFVGVQWGQFLVDRLGFAWTIASDRQGTDLAVRALPGQGDVLLYPANFVAKRWEKREANFLAGSFDSVRQQVEAVAAGRPLKPWWRFW